MIMLKGETIFILSLMKFDGLPSTNFTISKYLAKDNDVYYIEHPLTIKGRYKADKTSPAYLKRKPGLSKRSNGLLAEKIDGVNILISPVIYPVNGLRAGRLYEFFNRKNEQIVADRIKQIVAERKIKKYIFINFYDYNLPLVGNYLNASLNVYYCVDPVPHYDRKHGLENEKKLVAASDLVICTSQALFEEKKMLNANTHFVPNASDLVKTVDITKLKRSEKLKNISRPVVGYVGAIERRFDYPLLQAAIDRLKEINFVFVGPVHSDFVPQRFFDQKNVFFLPPVGYDEVPEMMNSFDVCIIPFKKDEISKTIFPLKLFEYLGLGKPVVITNFNPDLKDFTGQLVDVTETADQFVNAILKNIESPGSPADRRKLAFENTWDKRAEKISAILAKF